MNLIINNYYEFTNNLTKYIYNAYNNIPITTLPKVVAVSKSTPISNIITAYSLGMRHFGENYTQEFQIKASTLAKANYNIIWHYLGKIQSNKIKYIAKYASWVHSLTNINHAVKLNEKRETSLPPLKVLLEVKISSELESTKHGLKDFKQILKIANIITKLPNLELCGLMGIATHTTNQEQIKQEFLKLHDLFIKLKFYYPLIKELSMGMSNDYPLAISCGATIIRIGRKIFGERNL